MVGMLLGRTDGVKYHLHPYPNCILFKVFVSRFLGFPFPDDETQVYLFSLRCPPA